MVKTDQKIADQALFSVNLSLFAPGPYDPFLFFPDNESHIYDQSREFTTFFYDLRTLNFTSRECVNNDDVIKYKFSWSECYFNSDTNTRNQNVNKNTNIKYKLSS